ncbi:DUF4824 family protein [Pseudomonas sp. SA3-5]|uniref:DUF4824 family protein n=1 Tax=Pseudomonas aestuarii TaxID=3018340 RepID=A0ABT4XHI3_9PSED|nr:DUF4824 family protein [Pseudomonas aestuarii]MDA7087613.1 DUF4824 family protein [Pseudomonas aestuarii]
MTPWSTRRRLWLGLGLILLSNALALAGVYYNRSGEPESRLTLSERELQWPYGDWFQREDNSGLRLQLRWRRADAYGSLDWLSADKLQALGFQLPDFSRGDWQRRLNRQLARPVVLVLELAGPAYQRQVQQARQALAEAEERVRSRPDDQELQRQRDGRREQLSQEEQRDSRLFLIDAGLDAQALRQTYPDRQRYLLLGGRLKPHAGSGKAQPGGFSAAIYPDQLRISVPHGLREVFSDWPQGGAYRAELPPLQVQLAFGRRYEPWILEASRR